MDFSLICRTCMKTHNLNPIFRPTQPPEKYSAAIHAGTGLQVKYNDKLPQNMCTYCIIQLNNMLQFRKKCQDIEKKLLILLEDSTNSLSDILIKNVPIKKEDDVDIESQLNCFILTNLSNTLENDECISPDPIENSDNITNYLKDESYYDSKYEAKDSLFIPEVPKTIKKGTKRKKQKKLLKTNEIDENESFSTVKLEAEEEKPYVITDTSCKVARVTCKLCQKELSIRSIDSHMERQHPGADERKVKCDLCDRYIMRNQLKRHNALMHGAVNVIKCLYCKKEFETKALLMEHVRSCDAKKRQRKANDSGRKLSACDVCQKVMQRASLKMHKAVTHAGMKPVCEHCGRSFSNKLRLMEHYRAKHGYEKFKCSYCDFTSASDVALKNHERRHRGEKPYVCESCGAKFHAAYLLLQHRHSHRTEKLVKCELCPSRFKSNNNLNMHKVTCHNKSIFSCTVCCRTYKCRYYAVKHVRQAHEIAPGTEMTKISVALRG
ncbi:zinc finger protein interacting with ribonucleoprotein K-like [Trichoplusia ni]|uniref:Zinc finger protein interacting with ribonucleoprotein K-like n=1 Tax=Trichoplusia ni TaxID=7111 RepID=A0A7E5X2J0_TRINI|nr:zinc finger protein interacting with ribonucleoprotein K-like [Trichoplusia ni]